MSLCAQLLGKVAIFLISYLREQCVIKVGHGVIILLMLSTNFFFSFIQLAVARVLKGVISTTKSLFSLN